MPDHCRIRTLLRSAALVVLTLLLIVPQAYAAYGDEPSIAAKAAVLYEVNTGQILLDYNMDAKLYPASTTKIMTALLALERGKLDDVLTVTKSALAYVTPQSSIAGLKEGEQMTLEDMLVCLLIPSGNDAAAVIAEYIGGSIDGFVGLMNERARELGMANTHFVNPSGLHDENHYTSAHDLLLVTLEALKNPIFLEITSMAQAEVGSTNMSKERTFNTTNHFMSTHRYSKYYYAGVRGIKTGKTTPAGNCLVSSMDKDGMFLVSVVLGAPDQDLGGDAGVNIMSYVDTKAMFTWAQKSFSYREILRETDPIAEAKVQLAQDRDYVVVHPDSGIRALLHKSVNIEDFARSYTLDEGITAPVRQGDHLGQVTITYQGKAYGTKKLLAMNGVQRSDVLYYFDLVEKFFARPGIKFAVLGLVLLVILFIIYMVVHNRRRRMRAAMYRRRRRY